MSWKLQFSPRTHPMFTSIDTDLCDQESRNSHMSWHHDQANREFGRGGVRSGRVVGRREGGEWYFEDFCTMLRWLCVWLNNFIIVLFIPHRSVQGHASRNRKSHNSRHRTEWYRCHWHHKSAWDIAAVEQEVRWGLQYALRGRGEQDQQSRRANSAENKEQEELLAGCVRFAVWCVSSMT